MLDIVLICHDTLFSSSLEVQAKKIQLPFQIRSHLTHVYCREMTALSTIFCMDALALWEKFLVGKTRYLLVFGIFISAVGLLVAYMQSGPSCQDYLVAQTAFERWADSPQDSSLLRTLQDHLKKVPLLEKKIPGIHSTSFTQLPPKMNRTSRSRPPLP